MLLDGHSVLGKQMETRNEERKFVISARIRQTL